MKKLLIIGWVWPEPNSSAAGSRMLQLIQSFQQQGYAISFACTAMKTPHMADLSVYSVDCVEIKLNCASFDDFIRQLQPQVVMFDRYMIEEQFGWRVSEQCPQAMKILDTEDLFCLRHARHQAFKQQRLMTESDLLTAELAQREVAAIFRCDLSLMISPKEIDILVTLFKVDPSLLHYCPLMYAAEQYLAATPTFADRQGFIAIGNFRHAPNWDAVLWLKQQIWPLIRAKIPDAQLTICGAYPPPKASALEDKKSGFIVKGWVNDAILAMQSARVCLAPLRFGAGIKGKLAEAMLCATPSVTTEIGSEGMTSELGWPGIVANNAQALAQAAIELYQQADLWQQCSDLGPKNAALLFSQETHFSALAARVCELNRTLAAHRQQNFIGAMLNHHHHKSTKYMAQWIAAKNQRS